ncbi:MAG: magnesium/cobalt efflux protein [Hyphomonas sp. 32-62-5]|nr:MAG: magnesium/cobalt efflux protein [Hyphomonas sp. 32-62-5]
MSDSDPSDAAPSGRLRNLFGFRKKVAEPVNATGKDTEPAGAPQVMRLRLAEFEELRVDDVMVPRADIKAVEAGIDFQELLEFFAEVTHSRLPVFRETLDDPIGFVHIKDLVTELAKGGPLPRRPLERMHREVLYVPPSMKLTDLLVKMQATRIHLALVVADARMEIEDFQEESGVDLSLDDLDADIDTLGGVAFALAGKVPARGEVLRHPGGTEIEIVDADSRRVRRLRLRLPEPPPQPAAEE